MRNFLRETLITLGLALAIFLVLQTTIQSSIVDGSSMEPGLEDGQRLIVVKAAFWFDSPERGDIIIIHPPSSPDKQWVKRVIGIPGDTVEVKNGKVYLDGVELEEPYIKAEPSYTMKETVVPENNYFVMGDNRNNSTDSHYGWTVEEDKVVGEVWLRFWPFNEWGIISEYPISDQLEE